MAGQRFRTRLATFTSIVAGFLTLFVLTLALVARAEAYVYWTNPGAGTIGRANLDGTGVDHSFITGAGDPDGVAVNSTHVYWVNSGGPVRASTIGRAILDGTGVNPRFIADVTVGPALAVDDKHIYWVSSYADSLSPGTGAIGRANVDGTGVDENFITGLDYPDGPLAVDGSHLYWTNANFDTFGGYAGPNRIGRANLDGTGVDQGFFTGGGEAGLAFVGLAVDETHFWWAHTGAHVEIGAIMRANLAGTGKPESVIVGEDFYPCGGIAVDDTHLYWTATYFPGASEWAPRIGRARLDGTRVINDFITAIDPDCGDVAVDGLGPPPADDFHLGKVKKNRRTGTAKLTVSVPGPGDLDLAKTKKVKADDELAEAAGREKLRVKPKGKARKRLNTEGKAKVKAKVTYTPDGGEPNTQSKKIKLIKRR